MTVVMRRGLAATLVLTVLLGSLGVLGAAPPAGAAPAPRAISTAERYIRTLLFDLQNQGDPRQIIVDLYGLEFYIEPDGPIPPQVEWMQRGEEGRAAVVEDLFAALMRREVDPTSRDFFARRLAATGRQKVMADLLASAEYHFRWGGGQSDSWVDALYRDALGRPADPAGRQFFLDQLAAGRSRASIASFFTGGSEGRRVLVRRLMTELLRRPADTGGVTFFAGKLAAGTSVEKVIAMIATSPEYTAKAEAAPAPAVEVVLLMEDGRLRSQQLPDDAATDPATTVAVTGLADGDELVAIDVRPGDGTVVGVTDGGQVVTIAADGEATAVGLPLAGFDATGGAGLDVPAADDVAEVVAGSRSYTVDLDTGAATSATVAYDPLDIHRKVVPVLVAGAGHGDVRYGLDAAADALVTRTAAGVLATVGPLHANVGAVAGLDVSPDAPHRAYAVLDLPEAGPSFWWIDLATGEPRYLDDRLVEGDVVDLAVVGEVVVSDG